MSDYQEKLPPEVQTFKRVCTSLVEEAEAICSYECRIAVETDADAIAVMAHAQGEEFDHFATQLEFLLRVKPTWADAVRSVLFKPGPIVETDDDDGGESTSSAQLNAPYTRRRRL